MKLTIIIPCYNEQSTIKEIVQKINLQKNINKEIIIIDDNSTDRTKEILEKELRNEVNKIILNDKNYGKGYSIRKGIENASGDYTLIQDADLEYDPNDYKKLLRPIENGNADVVYGSRFIGGDEKRVLYFWHTMGNKFLTLIQFFKSILFFSISSFWLLIEPLKEL